MITIQIKVVDEGDTVLNVTAVVPNLFLASTMLNKASDLVSDHIEYLAPEQLQEK